MTVPDPPWAVWISIGLATPYVLLLGVIAVLCAEMHYRNTHSMEGKQMSVGDIVTQQDWQDLHDRVTAIEKLLGVHHPDADRYADAAVDDLRDPQPPSTPPVAWGGGGHPGGGGGGWGGGHGGPPGGGGGHPGGGPHPGWGGGGGFGPHPGWGGGGWGGDPHAWGGGSGWGPRPGDWGPGWQPWGEGPWYPGPWGEPPLWWRIAHGLGW